jgi:hypothetical protein
MEAIMNTDQYKQRLLAMEEDLSLRMKRAGATAREPADDSTSDAGDESVSNEWKEEQLWKVDTDRTILRQVQDALERIENSTLVEIPRGWDTWRYFGGLDDGVGFLFRHQRFLYHPIDDRVAYLRWVAIEAPLESLRPRFIRPVAVVRIR